MSTGDFWVEGWSGNPGEGFGPRLRKAESGMFAPACLGAKPSAPHLDAPGSPEKATWMPKGLVNCGGTGS